MLTGLAGDELSGLFDDLDFHRHRTIVAAVSGGGDSSALLLLLKSFLDGRGREVRLVAVTVDHGLRPQSSEEAATVVRLCAQEGVAHRIVHWIGAKPKAGLAAAAREARYRLLSKAAEAEDASLVLTGHTADDQAETILMRRARGPGRGLAGMAPGTLFEGTTWFVRPLLAVRRQVLRDYLMGRGAGWIEDPSNSDRSFERARVRATLQGTRDGDELTAQALGLAARSAAERVEVGRGAAEGIARWIRQPSPGLFSVGRGLLDDFGRAEAVQAFQILLAVVGGVRQATDPARTANLIERLRASPYRATLSRCVVQAQRNGALLWREGRGLPQPETPMQGAIWDGRFRLLSSEDVEDGLTVAPSGMQVSGVMDRPERLALARQPALFRESEWLGRLSPSSLHGVTALPVAAPWARLLPSFDLAPASAAAALIGGEPPPPPPWQGDRAIEA